jgi:hypothetical protein
MSTTTPTKAIGRPAAVISNTPSGSPPAATSRSDTTRFVDVPITVRTPPSTAAYDSGIRYVDAEMPARRHHVTTRGAARATSVVVGRTADNPVAVTHSRASRLRSLPDDRPAIRLSTSGFSAPVMAAAPASTYNAAIVTGALDDSPDSASC